MKIAIVPFSKIKAKGTLAAEDYIPGVKVQAKLAKRKRMGHKPEVDRYGYLKNGDSAELVLYKRIMKMLDPLCALCLDHHIERLVVATELTRKLTKKKSFKPPLTFSEQFELEDHYAEYKIK